MNRLTWFTIFGVGMVGILGVKTGELIWDKYIQPKVNKK